MDIEFSVIIPVWNLEQYIARSLESVVNQTFTGNYEVIVCLGDSHDNTEKIVLDYQEKYKKIRLLKCFHGSTMDLRLKGIKEAKGKYIVFLDADDYYHETYLETMHNEVKKSYDIVNCSFYCDRINRITKNRFVKNKVLSRDEACKALLQDTYMRGFLWQKAFKRELFEMSKLVLPKSKEQFFEDTMFVFEIFTRATSFKSIKAPIYYYLINSESVTHCKNPNRVNYHLSAYLVLKILCERSGDKKLVKSFRHKLTLMRLMLLYDAHLARKATKKCMIREYLSHKDGIRILKSKKPVNLDNYNWKQYVLDCLKPIE